MAAHPQNLLFLIPFSCLVILSACAQGTTNFVYNGFKASNLRLDGIATIHPNGLLQLTNTSVFQKGHALYPIPLRLSASPTLSTTFAFAIQPHPRQGGHGLAFVVSSSMDFSRAGDTYFLGLFNESTNGDPSNHVFAVELDTNNNAQVADIDRNRVGIDVNSLTSVDAAPAQYYSDHEGKNLSLNLLSGEAMQVWIDYVAKESVVEVAIAPLGLAKPTQLLLSTRVNLSEVLLDTIYIGFSASTGSFSSDHYVLGWSFSTNGTSGSLDLSTLPSLPKERRKVSRHLIALIVVLSVFLILFVMAAYVIRRKKYEEVMEEWEEEYAPQRFSYRDLYNATKGFEDKGVLGVGGFGKVYRGFLSSTNSQVAIKRVSRDSKQGMKEFVAEIASMRRLRHRNLVPFLGYCRRKGELLLVYEYMPNGSLHKHLFKKEQPPLPWQRRFNVIKGVASALHYLHEEWEQVVLHRDIKTSNVLLDGDMNARLGDFGLARLHDHGGIAQTTHVVGTFGYIAPEIPRTGKASTRTDVYAFGVFMLEVACGRRPLSKEGETLLEWVFQCSNKGAIVEASDTRLEGNYDTREMELVLHLGLLCSQARPKARPAMRQVIRFLNGDDTLPQVPIDCVDIDAVTLSIGSQSSLPLPSFDEACAIYSYSSSDSAITNPH